jgi:hypothetical protein
MAMCRRGHRVGVGLVENMEQEKAEVARLWWMVARVGQDDSVALGQAGYAIAFVYRDLPSAKELAVALRVARAREMSVCVLNVRSRTMTYNKDRLPQCRLDRGSEPSVRPAARSSI